MLVKATMGQLHIVFLMKWVQDLLTFVDPFTNMKEYVKELSVEAGERTVREDNNHTKHTVKFRSDKSV